MNDNIEIKARCIQVVEESLGRRLGDVKPESRFIEDLGADSLDQIELVLAFEEEFGIKISDEEAEKIATVQQAVDLVRRELG